MPWEKVEGGRERARGRRVGGVKPTHANDAIYRHRRPLQMGLHVKTRTPWCTASCSGVKKVCAVEVGAVTLPMGGADLNNGNDGSEEGNAEVCPPHAAAGAATPPPPPPSLLLAPPINQLESELTVEPSELRHNLQCQLVRE
jgi:hypothetical protein